MIKGVHMVRYCLLLALSFAWSLGSRPADAAPGAAGVHPVVNAGQQVLMGG